MSLRDLPVADRDIALQCLRYLLESRCFDENEFHTRLGMYRAELAMVVSRWPKLEDEDPSHGDYLALNNCFNEVCNGLHFSSTEWQKWFSASRNAVCDAYTRWRQSLKTNA